MTDNHGKSESSPYFLAYAVPNEIYFHRKVGSVRAGQRYVYRVQEPILFRLTAWMILFIQVILNNVMFDILGLRTSSVSKMRSQC